MKNKWINTIGNLLLVISVLFIGRSLYKQDINIRLYINSGWDIGLFSAVIGIYILTIYLGAYVYYTILSIFSKKIIDKDIIKEVYISSNLGKYLPGNVMHFVGRNVLGSQYNISQKDMAISTILELILVLLVSGIIILVFGYKYITSVVTYLISNYFNIIIIIGIVIILACGAICYVIYKFKHKIKSISSQINYTKFNKSMIRCVGIDFFSQIISGSTYVIVLMAICNGRFENWVSIIAIYLMAWFIGFIMPGVPGGIGIKESILILLLNGMIPKNIVLISVVIHRCLNIIAEVLAFISIKIMLRIKRRSCVEDKGEER